MKKTIILLCSALALANSYATVCPSVTELKSKWLAGWHAYNSDSGEPITGKALAKFEKNVKTFYSADYFDGAPEGAAQCNYRGANGDYVNVYLAQIGLYADLNKSTWHQESSNHYVCTRSLSECTFVYAGEKTN